MILQSISHACIKVVIGSKIIRRRKENMRTSADNVWQNCCSRHKCLINLHLLEATYSFTTQPVPHTFCPRCKNTSGERTLRSERLAGRYRLCSRLRHADRWLDRLRTMAGCWQNPQSTSSTWAVGPNLRKLAYRTISTTRHP